MEKSATNLFARQREEYAAVKEYIRLSQAPTSAGRAALMDFLALDAALTPRQREVIQMYYLDEMSLIEIGDELDICISAVSRTLSRGRNALKMAAGGVMSICKSPQGL